MSFIYVMKMNFYKTSKLHTKTHKKSSKIGNMKKCIQVSNNVTAVKQQRALKLKCGCLKY